MESNLHSSLDCSHCKLDSMWFDAFPYRLKLSCFAGLQGYEQLVYDTQHTIASAKLDLSESKRGSRENCWIGKRASEQVKN